MWHSCICTARVMLEIGTDASASHLSTGAAIKNVQAPCIEAGTERTISYHLPHQKLTLHSMAVPRAKRSDQFGIQRNPDAPQLDFPTVVTGGYRPRISRAAVFGDKNSSRLPLCHQCHNPLKAEIALAGWAELYSSASARVDERSATLTALFLIIIHQNG